MVAAAEQANHAAEDLAAIAGGFIIIRQEDARAIDRARHLLIQSTMPVVEVAVACGFVSASHFSKCYRELYARSPQQERADRKQLLVAVAA